MKALISILNIILICLYFANLLINHEYGFNFYLVVIIIIASFLTVFNFLELKNNDKKISSSKRRIFRLINYLSYASIVLCIIMKLSLENIDQKYGIIFYIYSINILLFAYLGFKYKYLLSD